VGWLMLVIDTDGMRVRNQKRKTGKIWIEITPVKISEGKTVRGFW